MGLADFYQLTQRIPEAQKPFQGATPDYGYGNRWDRPFPKQKGYYGEIGHHGGVSGEISVGDDYGEFPTMVPGLTRDELQGLIDSTQPLAFKGAGAPPRSAMEKAYMHAQKRRLAGQDPFATVQDPVQELPPIDRLKEVLRGTY